MGVTCAARDRFYGLFCPALQPANRVTISRAYITDCIQHNTTHINCIQSHLHQFNIALKAFSISGTKCNKFNIQLIINNMPQHAPSPPANLNQNIVVVAIEFEQQCLSGLGPEPAVCPFIRAADNRRLCMHTQHKLNINPANIIRNAFTS